MSPRKLKRGMLGRKVECSICEQTVPITSAREYVNLAARTSSAAGTLTDVKLMQVSGVHVCDRCVMLKEAGLDPRDPRYANHTAEELTPQQVELAL